MASGSVGRAQLVGLRDGRGGAEPHVTKEDPMTSMAQRHSSGMLDESTRWQAVLAHDGRADGAKGRSGSHVSFPSAHELTRRR